MNQSQQDRFAVVTGGASGIGRAIAQRLAAMGYRLAVIDADEAGASEVCRELGDAATPILMDVADADAWRRAAAELRVRWPRLDLLANNAGVLAGGELKLAALDDLRRVVEVNLIGTLTACHTLAPWLLESATQAGPAPRRRVGQPRPGIINTASVAATLAFPGLAAYCASKAGVVALSEALRGELAPHGLNVTVTLPGVTRTALFERGRFTSADFKEAIIDQREASELTAERVAEATLRAAARGRPFAVIGRRALWYERLKRLAPAMTSANLARRARNKPGIPAE